MAAGTKITLSVMTADVGGFVGHVSSHPDVLDTAKERLYNARSKGIITDYHILRCGDDLELIITHAKGLNSREVHGLAWNVFTACRDVARELKLHEPDRGLSKNNFNGSLKRMGPGVAEMEFAARESEPVVVFMANKTSTGAWNLPLYRIFSDPFNTPGLFSDPFMLEGFTYNVHDTREDMDVLISTPREAYQLLSLIGSSQRYLLTEVYRDSDREITAAISAPQCHFTGDRVTGKSEPAAIFRCHGGLPSVGEVMEPFSFPHLVAGCMGGARSGPLMPVPFYEANPTRLDGPARVICAGFQVTDARLIGPHDMFDDPGFDNARQKANTIEDYMRRHGPFQPGFSAETDMEYAVLPAVLENFKERFKKAP